MNRIFNACGRALRRFRRSEDGSSTLEFVIMVPIAMMLFTTSFESGMLSTRQVMLERGVEMTIRKIRIGGIPVPTVEILKEEICKSAKIIPDCVNSLRIEMVVREARNFAALSARPTCIDREKVVQPAVDFSNGGNNDLMILRVCALFKPFMPTSTFGQAIPKESAGEYALTATSAFVMEPFK